jgi:prepilin signal peptidase PulO-like enzyme (type II secretory pathway)
MLVVLLIVGLIIGSFLGAYSYRLPRRISIRNGRSKCPNCHTQIKPLDNIPILSFIFLGGKCRNCKEKISLRYPLIEISTAITFAIIGFNPAALILASVLILIFVIDLEHQIIPDELVFFGLVIFIIFNFQNNLYTNLLAGLLSAITLLFLNLITKGKGMGLGDVKLAILLGAIVGIDLFLIWLFLSFLSGAIMGIILIIFQKAKIKSKIAFGPFLVIGLILTYFFGNTLLRLIGI